LANKNNGRREKMAVTVSGRVSGVRFLESSLRRIEWTEEVEKGRGEGGEVEEGTSWR